MVGASVEWIVRIDGRSVANLRQGAYAVVFATPGSHTITIGDSTVFFGGGALNAGLNAMSQSGEAQAADNGTFVAVANGVYFLRSKGFGVDMLPREEAMKDIVEMKYDMGL
jgi:capsule polysaccharide export protein KpsC/LpsZ